MDKVKWIIPVALSVVLLLGCKTTTQTTRKSAFYPDEVHLRINMSELEVVGETEITVSYHTYLGLITVINEVNGEQYDPYNVQTTSIEGVSFGMGSQLNKAAAKILDEYPGATYYHLVYKKKTVDPLILGKEILETALVRAYNFK
jgi:hypothetical protein